MTTQPTTNKSSVLGALRHVAIADRSVVLSDGTTVREGTRVYAKDAEAFGTVTHVNAALSAEPAYYHGLAVHLDGQERPRVGFPLGFYVGA